MQLTATGGNSYIWYPTKWIFDNYNMPNPQVCPPRTSYFYVKATGSNGCSVLDSVKVIVFITGLFIPNTFTPNGKGRNEKWVIKNIEKYPGNKVIIYNRWGQEVFSARDYNNEWDGGGMAVGTYYYIIDLNNGDKIKGDVNIIK
jgi:gliding motility-associated-like protein